MRHGRGIYIYMDAGKYYKGQESTIGRGHIFAAYKDKSHNCNLYYSGVLEAHIQEKCSDYSLELISMT